MTSVLLAFIALIAAPGVQSQGLRGLETLGTEFRLTLANGAVVPREKLIGATLAFTEPDGTATRLRIDGVEVDAQDPSGEVLLYRLSVPDPATPRPCSSIARVNRSR